MPPSVFVDCVARNPRDVRMGVRMVCAHMHRSTPQKLKCELRCLRSNLAQIPSTPPFPMKHLFGRVAHSESGTNFGGVNKKKSLPHPVLHASPFLIKLYYKLFSTGDLDGFLTASAGRGPAGFSGSSTLAGLGKTGCRRGEGRCRPPVHLEDCSWRFSVGPPWDYKPALKE